MEKQILSSPYFRQYHLNFAEKFERWVSIELKQYENNEGGDGRAARAIFRLLGKTNWLKQIVPDNIDSNNFNLNLRKTCLIREILGYRATILDVAFSEPWLGILPIAIYGSSKLKSEILPGYLSGNVLPAFALSEPTAGSDVAAIKTHAKKIDDHFILSGKKKWISNAGVADLYVVFAKTGDKEISAFIIDGDLPGINLEERFPVLSPHTVGTLRFDNVKVPNSCLLGRQGQGFKIAMSVLELFRPTVGASAVGLARRAMDEAIKQSTSRVAFNKKICDHQLIKDKIADMAMKVASSSFMVYNTAWLHDVCKARITKHASMAKLYATEMAQMVVDQAQQIFGGEGVVKGSVIETLYRNVRAFRIFDGTSEIQKLIISNEVLKEYHQ